MKRIIISFIIALLITLFPNICYAADYSGELSASGYVISSNSNSLVKTFGNFLDTAGWNVKVCDGVDDEVEIQAAIDALGKNVGQDQDGGNIHLTGGRFIIADQIDLYSSVHISGAGMGATQLIASQLPAWKFVFRTKNNTNQFSIRDLSIRGSGNTNPNNGGIMIGNDSTQSGYTAYFSLVNVEVRGFTGTSAMGIKLANPSHGAFVNVRSQGITNGTGILIVANMTNTGVISFSGCKFGQAVDTLTGTKFVSSSNSSAALDSFHFAGTYFGGEVRSLWLATNTSPAHPHRMMTFDACHFETNNTDSGSEIVLIQSGVGIGIIRSRLHGFGNTDYGIRFDNAGEVAAIELIDNEFVNIDNSGQCIRLDTSGAGSYNVIRVGSILRFGTTATPLYDPGDNVRLIDE